jgi:hypothetical protein
MEFENEVRLAFSPGARVVVGYPLVPLLAAVAIGCVLGAAIAMLAQRPRSARCGRPRSDRAGAAAPQLRMPGDNPDVETEL